MREIPAEIIQEYLSREYRPFWLLEFTVGGTTFRITDCDVPIAIDGNVYTPRGFQIPSFRYSERQMVDAISLRIDNLDSYYTSAFVGGTPQGADVYARQVYLDDNYRPVGESAAPVLWLRLADGWAAIAGDSSGNRENFALTGSPSWTNTGPNSQGALDLDGATQSGEADDGNLGNFTSEDYSICIFIKPNATQEGTNRRLLAKDYSVGGWELFAQDSTVELRHYASSTTYQKRHSLTTLDDGSWHSIVIIRTGTDAALYIDNVRKAWNLNDDDLPDPDSTTDHNLTIGKRADAASYYWKGEVADLIVFDRAIRRSEVAAYHAGIFAGPRTGPIGYWKIDEGFGDDIIDHSGNGKDGSLTHSPPWVTDAGQGRKVVEFDADSELPIGSHTIHRHQGDLTQSVWVYFDIGSFPGAGNFILNDQEVFQASGYMWRINGTTGVPYFRSGNTGTHSDAKSAGSAVPTQQWVHLAVRWRAGKCQHFLNGAPDGAEGFFDVAANPTSQVRLADPGSTTFDCRFANFQMYERALTDDEIEAIYNDGLYGVAGPGLLTLFEGGLDAWTMNDKILKFSAKSEMARWTQRPLSLHSVSCRWKDFKGTECGYAGGATWCDRTYTRCDDLGNAANFGGFRWLPSIMDKKIWWGKVPK